MLKQQKRCSNIHDSGMPYYTETIHDSGNPYYTETIHLIRTANQLNGFYEIKDLTTWSLPTDLENEY